MLHFYRSTTIAISCLHGEFFLYKCRQFARNQTSKSYVGHTLFTDKWIAINQFQFFRAFSLKMSEFLFIHKTSITGRTFSSDLLCGERKVLRNIESYQFNRLAGNFINEIETISLSKLITSNPSLFLFSTSHLFQENWYEKCKLSKFFY